MEKRNVITESWHEAPVTCNLCGARETVLIDPDRWDKYIKGGLVQDVWPEASPAYREQIIGIRSGYHVCNNCWGSVGDEFEEEE